MFLRNEPVPGFVELLSPLRRNWLTRERGVALRLSDLCRDSLRRVPAACSHSWLGEAGREAVGDPFHYGDLGGAGLSSVHQDWGSCQSLAHQLTARMPRKAADAFEPQLS